VTAPQGLGTDRAIYRCLIGGAAVVGLLVCALGGWAATTHIAGAVIARGSLVVDTNVKKVQHPTGGIVGELLVRDGDVVHQGDVLLRLDDTITRTNLGVITKNIDELTARQARLKAEQDGRAEPRFPDELTARSNEQAVAELLRDERRLFDLRIGSLSQQTAQLNERVAQLRQQIAGTASQNTANAREIVLIHEELAGVRELWEKRLVPITRLAALEREEARLEGEHGALVATDAQLKGKITETELQILQINQDYRTSAGKDLAAIRAELAELMEKRTAAEDQLRRVDIRSPQDGIIHELAVHTVGGVINPGEQVMLIVPLADTLIIEARVAPQDIDQILVGHKALLRFSAFNRRTTPEITGEVTRVSGDVSHDSKTGAQFYTIRITPSPADLGRLNGLKLVPGMPVESFIQTGERTVISYLIKPIEDQVVKAWREK
jgi:HlyD family secretion protein